MAAYVLVMQNTTLLSSIVSRVDWNGTIVWLWCKARAWKAKMLLRSF